MANMTGKLNEVESWVSAGAGDVLTYNVMRESGSKGFQIEVDGVALDTLTITAFGHTGASKVITVEAGTGEIGFIGVSGASLAKLTISGAAAATYKVKLTPL